MTYIFFNLSIFYKLTPLLRVEKASFQPIFFFLHGRSKIFSVILWNTITGFITFPFPEEQAIVHLQVYGVFTIVFALGTCRFQLNL